MTGVYWSSVRFTGWRSGQVVPRMVDWAPRSEESRAVSGAGVHRTLKDDGGAGVPQQAGCDSYPPGRRDATQVPIERAGPYAQHLELDDGVADCAVSTFTPLLVPAWSLITVGDDLSRAFERMELLWVYVSKVSPALSSPLCQSAVSLGKVAGSGTSLGPAIRLANDATNLRLGPRAWSRVAGACRPRHPQTRRAIVR